MLLSSEVPYNEEYEGVKAGSYIPKAIKVAALNGSAREIYQLLTKRSYKVEELTQTTKFSTRTIRYTLKHLQSIGLIARVPDMNDLRSHKYRAK